MSRTYNTMPREVLATRWLKGWQWVDRIYAWAWHSDAVDGFVHRRRPTNPAMCCGGDADGPGVNAKRCYWKNVRAQVRSDLENDREPDPTRPRNSVKYMYY